MLRFIKLPIDELYRLPCSCIGNQVKMNFDQADINMSARVAQVNFMGITTMKSQQSHTSAHFHHSGRTTDSKG